MPEENQRPESVPRCRAEEMVQTVVSTVEAPVRPLWWVLLACSLLLALGGLGGGACRIAHEGVGVLGVNNQVPWGLDIVHFVFWIGLGHAGTLISSVLLLTGQHWRSPIARGAELMTLCAVFCAAIFPMVHVGRVWMIWMVSPLPEVSGIWPNPASPLVWDALAVSTYFLLSLTYWYVGLVPDFAVLRDRCAALWRKKLYGVLCLGWQGSGSQWGAYERVSVLMAAVLAPLVVTVHSVVGFDFAVTVQPGWHESIIPPYFVAGAILSGMAMVQLILLVVLGLQGKSVGNYISKRVLGMTGRFILALSLVMGIMYFWEHFCAMLNGGEKAAHAHERMDDGGVFFAMMLIGNVLLPQLYWFKRLRRNRLVILAVALGVLAGMWSERWYIVVDSMKSVFIGAVRADYVPTSTDVSMGVGSLALFIFLYMVLMRMTPFFSLGEMRSHLNAADDVGKQNGEERE